MEAQGKGEAIAALEAELAQERERRAAIERQRDEQALELAALHDQLAPVGHRPQPGAEAREPSASRLVELPDRLASPGTAYWLRRCEGFRLETDSGLVGRIEGVRFGRRHDRPDALVVVLGRWRHRRLLVSVEEVEEAFPEEGRITLSCDPPGWSPAASHRDDLALPLRHLARRLHEFHALSHIPPHRERRVP